MRLSPIWLLCCFLAGSGFAADAAVVGLKYDAITLSDGRILKNVVVKSYDAKTGKLLLLAEGRAMNVPVELVPDPLGASLKAGVPKAGGSTTATQQRAVYPPVIRPAGPEGAPKVVSSAAKSPDQKMQSHLDAARATARTQVMASQWKGAVKKVTIVSCELEDPVPAEGWIDRYKVRGTIAYDCLDGAGASLRQGSTRFEVTTEFPASRSSVRTLDYVELTETGAPRPVGPKLTPQQLAELNKRPPAGPTVVSFGDPMDAHKKVARDRAQSYYEASFVGRSAPSMDFEIGEPEPVTGWNGRYRTPGKVTFHHFDRGSGSLRATTAMFEVETENNGNSPPQVVGFTPKT